MARPHVVPPDAISRAIVATGPFVATVALLGVGRSATISVPPDIADVEWLGLVAALVKVRDDVVAQRRARAGVS